MSLQICLYWIVYHSPQTCVMLAHGVVSMFRHLSTALGKPRVWLTIKYCVLWLWRTFIKSEKITQVRLGNYTYLARLFTLPQKRRFFYIKKTAIKKIKISTHLSPLHPIYYISFRSQKPSSEHQTDQIHTEHTNIINTPEEIQHTQSIIWKNCHKCIFITQKCKKCPKHKCEMSQENKLEKTTTM